MYYGSVPKKLYVAWKMQRGHMALLVVEEELVTYIFFSFEGISQHALFWVSNKPQPVNQTKFTAYFVMKATGETAKFISFTYYLWLFHVITADLSSYDRDVWLTQNICYFPFKNSVSNPVQNCWTLRNFINWQDIVFYVFISFILTCMCQINLSIIIATFSSSECNQHDIINLMNQFDNQN